MATNNTYINAQDDFTVKGNLTVEGNVTQVSTTINENRVAAEEFIINSDGENTTAKLTFNSNNTLANISFIDGGNMVVEPNLQGNIIIGSGQTLTVAGGANIQGNVFFGNVSGVASEATMFTDLVTVVLSGDATGQAQFQGSGNTATIPLVLDSVNSNTGSFGDAATIPNFTVNAKGLLTAAGETAVSITSSQVSDFTTSARGVLSGSLGVEYNNSSGVVSLSQYGGAGQFGSATAVPQIVVDGGGRISSSSNVTIAIPSSQITDFTSRVRSNITVSDSGGDGSLAYNSTSGVITYTGPSASEVRAHFTGGTGIDISSGTVAIDNTVVQTTGTQTISGAKTFTGTVDLTGATLPGNITFAGNITATNIDTVTQTDSIITDNNIYLNQGGSNRDAKIQVERTPANAYLMWDDGTSRWQFSNDGSSDNNMLTLSDFSSGITSDIVTTGKILYSNMYSTEGDLPSASTYHGMFAHVHATGKGYFAHGGNWIKLLDETNSTTANLTEGSNLYYTTARANSAMDAYLSGGDGIDYTSGSIDVDSTVIRTTGNQSLAGDKTFTGKLVVPTTATTEANAIYSDGNEAYIYIDGVAKQITPTASVGSVEDVGAGEIDLYAGNRIASNVTYHGVKSLSSGTYTSVSENANVVTVEGDISAIRGAFSAVDNAGDGTFTYNSSTGQFSYSGVSQSQIRSEFSANGNTLSYDSGTGQFTSTADNYGNWKFDTETGSPFTVSSTEQIIFNGGTGIDITHSGNTISIVNTNTADITSVLAGTGLTGGGTSGDVTLNANSSFIRGLFSGSGDISYDSSTGQFSFTDSDRSDATIRGLFSGSSGVNYDNSTGVITADTAEIRAMFSGSGDISYDSSTGAFSFTDSDRSDATIRGLFSASGDLNYNSSTGVFSFTNDAGDIESVTAGVGLSGGGSSGAVTLDVIEATSSAYGGIKVGYTENSQNYPVELDSGKAFVNVPWVDTNTNTTYTAGTGLSLSGTQFNVTGLTVSELAGGSLQTSGETFANNDTSLMTSAAIEDKILSYGYSTTTGDITAVVAGNGLTGGATSGSATLTVDLSDTTTFTSTNTASRAVVRDGSGNFAAGTITATATQAQYADLAEKYEADADYEPGTVLVIGGEKEVTVTDEAGSYKVVGVVSTDPAYLMNSQANGVAVALRGRVPCKVIGNVNKGDVLVASDTPGYAMVGASVHTLSPLQIVGRALETKTDAQPGIIEIIV